SGESERWRLQSSITANARATPHNLRSPSRSHSLVRSDKETRMAWALILVALLGVTTAAAADPDWQIHSKWCTIDRGSSGSEYLRLCKEYDQFDSVIGCQGHNPG